MYEEATITGVRTLTETEYEHLNWLPKGHHDAHVLELSTGATLFPGRDLEGNGAGYFDGIPDDPTELVGTVIRRIAPLSEASVPSDWVINPHNPRPPSIELDTGTVIVPLADPEGNGPGTLWSYPERELDYETAETDALPDPVTIHFE